MINIDSIVFKTQKQSNTSETLSLRNSEIKRADVKKGTSKHLLWEGIGRNELVRFFNTLYELLSLSFEIICKKQLYQNEFMSNSYFYSCLLYIKYSLNLKSLADCPEFHNIKMTNQRLELAQCQAPQAVCLFISQSALCKGNWFILMSH